MITANAKELRNIADINKIGGICIRDKKLLIVHKKGVGYLSLGGKIEPGETDLECLSREVKEEIGCRVKNPKYFDTFEGPNHDGTQTLKMKCYFCELEGEIKLNPNDKIDGYTWIDRNYEQMEDQIAHMLRAAILPALIKKGLL